jgi:cellulose synthase/poly-beta-1,6-N-acetylglucosamine synthase-like glycosyltransferase
MEPVMELVTAPRLGDALVAKGLISPGQRDLALAAHERTGSTLTTTVISAGLVPRQDLYRVLAELTGVPFCDLTAEPPDPGLLAGLDPEQLNQEGWIPVRALPDGSVLVAAEHVPRPAFLASMEQALGKPVTFRITTDWDLRCALQRSLRTVIYDQAALGLWHQAAGQSARKALYPRQAAGLLLALAFVIVAFIFWPIGALQTLSVSVSVLFLLFVSFKFVVCMAGARRERYQAVTKEDLAALREEDLPVYTVLAPMYHEANVVGQLVANLSRLEYPVSKLEVLLLLEEDDAETQAAADAAGLPPWMSVIVVPRGEPQTKPKACNVGLFFARGEHLVIYDAEDKPDPEQLKKAVVAFRRGGERMVCVQAALNYWNVYENFLTRMFTAEYSFWFDYMLPGLDALRLPIPLGGTSNHFRTGELRQLGGWDPFNVTEDADLGIRAAARGFTVGVINSTTFEEANRKFGNWIRQRSRWIKGYMQTTLVHARSPWSLVKVCGVRQTLGFLLLVAGTPLSFLFVLPLWILFLVSLAIPAPIFAELYPGWWLWLGLFNLLVGNSLMIYVSMMGAFLRQRYGLVVWSLLNPVYWLLHSLASYKALWQLITRPHYWEKTTHGISALTAQPSPVPAGDVPRPRAPG